MGFLNKIAGSIISPPKPATAPAAPAAPATVSAPQPPSGQWKLGGSGTPVATTTPTPPPPLAGPTIPAQPVKIPAVTQELATPAKALELSAKFNGKASNGCCKWANSPMEKPAKADPQDWKKMWEKFDASVKESPNSPSAPPPGLANNPDAIKRYQQGLNEAGLGSQLAPIAIPVTGKWDSATVFATMKAQESFNVKAGPATDELVNKVQNNSLELGKFDAAKKALGPAADALFDDLNKKLPNTFVSASAVGFTDRLSKQGYPPAILVRAESSATTDPAVMKKVLDAVPEQINGTPVIIIADNRGGAFGGGSSYLRYPESMKYTIPLQHS